MVVVVAVGVIGKGGPYVHQRAFNNVLLHYHRLIKVTLMLVRKDPTQPVNNKTLVFGSRDGLILLLYAHFFNPRKRTRNLNMECT